MKGKVICILLGICLAAVAVAEPIKTSPHKKLYDDLARKLDAMLEMEEELENEIYEGIDQVKPGDANEDVDSEDEDGDEGAEDEELAYDSSDAYALSELEDPCAEIYCSAGRACVVNNKGKGVCQCVEACEEETDPRRRVCSNHNETWMTDCDLHRQRCLCVDDMPGCQEEKYKHLHIDYFGQCQELPSCEEEEFSDFPRRMREWLFNVMRDMADRQILSSHYQKLEKEAEEDESQKWSKAVVWKWCDLDSEPKDKTVSRHELFPLRAPLYTLEHCIAPFLDSCDPDENHRISLKEWIHCLQLDEEDTEDLEELCEDIRENEAENSN